MPNPMINYNVFIASPGGLGDEREAFRDTFHQYNELEANPRQVNFTAVGSVEAAMHTVGPLDSGPVISLLSQAPPHDLAALKQRSIAPNRLGYEKPDSVSDSEFSDVVAAFAGAELLDRERKLDQANRDQDRTTARWQIVWNVVGPLLGLGLGALLAYLGLK